MKFGVFTSFLAFSLFVSVEVFSQKTDSTKTEKPVITGGFNANSTFYTADGISARRDPFYWLLSGNVTVSYKGIVLPFSAQFSQQQRSFTQPFNQFGVSPKYKYITVHAGYRSLYFSELTLAGTVFLGGGVEVVPTNSLIKGVAMCGRLARPVNVGGVDGIVQGQPSFERWGYGGKVTIGRQKYEYNLVLFKAFDLANSIDKTSAETVGLKPQENLVLSVSGNSKVLPFLTIGGEYAWSGLNPNSESARLEIANKSNWFDPLLTKKEGFRSNNAILANATITAKYFQLKLLFRRIQPEYITLGSTFLVNDLQDLTLNFSSSLFQKKLNYTLSGGYQTNNLDKSKLTKTNRLVSSANISFNPNTRWSLQTSLANFNTTTQLDQFTQRTGTQQINSDSLYFLQVTQSASATISNNTNLGANKLTSMLMGNYQSARDNKQNKNEFYTLNMSENLNVKSIQTSFTAGLTYVLSKNQVQDQTSIGPSVSGSKTLLSKKLKITNTINMLNTIQNEQKANSSYSNRLAVSYLVYKNNTLSADFIALKNVASSTRFKNFTEYRAGINYMLSF